MMQAPGQPPAESGGSQDPPSQSVRCSTDGDENETRSLAKQIRGGEKWLIGIGVATLAINSIIALIYYCQLGEMRKAAIASGQAAGAATDAATSAQKALDQSRDLFLKDQRPYVGQTSKSTEGPTFYQNPKTPGYGQIVWNWHMTNYGKSPANSVSFTQEIKLAGRPFLPSYGKRAGHRPAPTPRRGHLRYGYLRAHAQRRIRQAFGITRRNLHSHQDPLRWARRFEIRIRSLPEPHKRRFHSLLQAGQLHKIEATVLWQVHRRPSLGRGALSAPQRRDADPPA